MSLGFGRSALLAMAAAAMIPLCLGAARAEGSLPRSQDYERALTEAGGRDAFLASLPKVTRADRTGVNRTYYLIEGDVLATEQEVIARLNELQFARQTPARQTPSGELLVMTDVGGRPTFWPKGQRALTYTVDRKSFQDATSYQTVVEAMVKASNAWVDACQDCGLSFSHRSDLDDAAPLSTEPTFIVRYVPEENRFIAASFFPNDPVFNRILTIGPQYFTTNFDRVGVLRHEIGHILGYRHMHIIGVPGCDVEDANWQNISGTYDRLSVMHYFCGGGGTRRLELSETDKRDHRTLYGP